MKHKQTTDWDKINGAGLRGYITTTYDRLVEVFGEPTDFDGDKTTVQWMIEFEDGTVATIYDWKESDTPMGMYEWHIGGRPHTPAASLVHEALQQKEVA